MSSPAAESLMSDSTAEFPPASIHPLPEQAEILVLCNMQVQEVCGLLGRGEREGVLMWNKNVYRLLSVLYLTQLMTPFIYSFGLALKTDYYVIL